MPYLMGNISSSKILNYGWLGVLKTWVVGLGDEGKKKSAFRHPHIIISGRALTDYARSLM